MADSPYSSEARSSCQSRACPKDRVTPKSCRSCIRLWEKRRELREVSRLFEAMKELHEERMAELRERQDRVEARQAEFRRIKEGMNVCALNKRAKRDAALRRAVAERREREAKSSRVLVYRMQLCRLRLYRDRVKRLYMTYMPMRQFYDGVFEMTSDFSTLSDMVSRHRSLTSNSRELRIKEKKMSDSLQEQRKEWGKNREDLSKIGIHMRNEKRRLHECLEHAEKETKLRRAQWLRVIDTASEMALELGCLRLVALSMYRLIVDYHKKDICASNTLEQLSLVKDFSLQMTSVVSAVKKSRISGAQAARSQRATEGLPQSKCSPLSVC